MLHFSRNRSNVAAKDLDFPDRALRVDLMCPFRDEPLCAYTAQIRMPGFRWQKSQDQSGLLARAGDESMGMQLIGVIEQHKVDHRFMGPHSREAEHGPMGLQDVKGDGLDRVPPQ